MSVHSMKEKTTRGLLLVFLILLLLLLAGAGFLGLRLFEGEAPRVELQGRLDYLGNRSEVALVAMDGRSGIRSVEVSLVQGDRGTRLLEQKLERRGYLSDAGPRQLEVGFEVEPKSLGFAEGEAQLVVAVRDYSFRDLLKGNLSVTALPVVIDTRPPQITVTSSTRYIRNGGAGVVVYRTSEPAGRHGVVLNDHFHPGHRAAGKEENTYVAYVAVPYNAESISSSYVTATDQAGNEARAAVGMIFRKKLLKKDRINISDEFLAGKMPEFGQHYELAGSPLEQFLTVNNQVRRENDRRIAEVCATSLPERLWEGAFSQMARGRRHAGFADHRTYFYQGQEIDQQYHLGVDLASVRHADVEAANRGRVVFADYLGIYGNMVILDHGQGVFSLYSHLNQINVQPGEILDRGMILGKTGTSGMAGGDHLHFAVLINGVFVDPLEWWDPSWLRVSVDEFL